MQIEVKPINKEKLILNSKIQKEGNNCIDKCFFL